MEVKRNDLKVVLHTMQKHTIVGQIGFILQVFN
jgi:hypothetical protein